MEIKYRLDILKTSGQISEKTYDQVEKIILHFQNNHHIEIIEENGETPDIVNIGDYVTVVEDGYDEEERYHLVGAAEARNPLRRSESGRQCHSRVGASCMDDTGRHK